MMLFGEFLRMKRREQKLSVRAFATEVGISPVYQSSIETGKRAAPSYEVLQRMVTRLGLSREEKAEFYDLAAAGASGKTVPPDITGYINQNAQLRALIRAARDGEITEADILALLRKAKRT